MTDFAYVDSELELFAGATTWKWYVRYHLLPYLTGDILEVGDDLDDLSPGSGTSLSPYCGIQSAATESASGDPGFERAETGTQAGKNQGNTPYTSSSLVYRHRPGFYDSGNGKLHTQPSRVAGHLATVVKFSQSVARKAYSTAGGVPKLLLRSTQTIPFFGPFDETTGVDPKSLKMTEVCASGLADSLPLANLKASSGPLSED
jgi:hypothetical protein